MSSLRARKSGFWPVTTTVTKFRNKVWYKYYLNVGYYMNKVNTITYTIVIN